MFEISLSPSLKLHKHSSSSGDLLILRDSTVPIIATSILVPSGLCHQPLEQSGQLSACIELLLRGNLRHNRTQFFEELETLGSYTRVHASSNYSLLKLTTLRKNAAKSFELIAQALHSPTFAASEVELYQHEKMGLLNTLQDDDAALLDIFMRQHLYGNEHPLSKLAPGTIKDIAKITPNICRNYFEILLKPLRTTTIMVGDIQVPEALEFWKLLQNSSPVPESPKNQQTHAPIPNPHENLDIQLVDFPNQAQIQMAVGQILPPMDLQTQENLWLGILGFGGTFASRFTQEIRENRGWSYSANASFSRRSHNREPILLNSTPEMDKMVDCLSLELDMFRTLQCDGLRMEEFNHTKNFLMNYLDVHLSSPHDWVPQLARCELLGLPVTDILELTQRLQSQQLPEINEALRNNLAPESLKVTIVGPAKALLPLLTQQFPTATIKTVAYKSAF